MRFFFLLKACFTGQPVKMLKNKQVWGLLFQNTTPKPIFTGLRGYYFYFFEFYRTPIFLLCLSFFSHGQFFLKSVVSVFICLVFVVSSWGYISITARILKYLHEDTKVSPRGYHENIPAKCQNKGCGIGALGGKNVKLRDKAHKSHQLMQFDGIIIENIAFTIGKWQPLFLDTHAIIRFTDRKNKKGWYLVRSVSP